MVSLYQDPKGEKIFEKSNPTADTTGEGKLNDTFTMKLSSQSHSDGRREQVALLNKRVQELEAIIHEKEAIIHEKEAIIHEKEVIIHEKEVIIHEKEAIIRENEKKIAEHEH